MLDVILIRFLNFVFEFIFEFSGFKNRYSFMVVYICLSFLVHKKLLLQICDPL